MKLLLLFVVLCFSINLFAKISLEEEKDVSRSSYKSSNKKFWYWSFFSIASEDSTAVTDGYGSIFSYNYFKAKHYLGKSATISLVPTFYVSTAGRRNADAQVAGGRIDIGDIYSEYQHFIYSNAFFKTKVGARLYLPLSFSSKKSDLKTRGQIYASVSGSPFYRFQAYYKAEANTYAYKGSTFVNKKKKTVGKKKSKFYHFLDLSYLFSEKFSVSSLVGQELSLYKKTPITESSKMMYSAGMAVNWKMAYKMSISLGLQNKIASTQQWRKLLQLSQSEVVVKTSIIF